ncbi:unnamed protein product [Paramecium pentaurelia]|uniref:Uncharacterized protein n=1 Tax=Paramecium pentaurelia TaxID=43138 RepID=A0A8S1SLA6_9CILI|nr:unnamed protein product [Paramecium pentaurelia]
MPTQIAQKQRNKSEKNKVHSILKCQKSHENRNRKDRSGNDIIHGGNYKITFQDSFIVLKTNSYTPQNEIDNYSESELSDHSESEQSQIQEQIQALQVNQTLEIVPKAAQTNCDLEIKIEIDQEFPKINSHQQFKSGTKSTQKSNCCITF